jgi:hypothetical protein
MTMKRPTESRTRLGGFLVAYCLICACSQRGLSQENITNSMSAPDTVVWRIERPNVQQAETDYPEISFQSGDQVAVQASGCVQTGGKGKTWKDYVHPQGDNSDRLYSGMISIPTITAGLVRIQTVLGNTYTIKEFPEGTDPSSQILRLGYQDDADSYGDNGYYSHDDGDNDQCKGVGDATIILTIKHAAPGAPIPIQAPKAPMDLWWEGVDQNALPKNPKWGAQVTAQNVVPDAGKLCDYFHDEEDVLKLGVPACTTQAPTVDEPNGWDQPENWAVCQLESVVGSHPPGTVHGHVNWGLATYTGTIYFQDWQSPDPTTMGDNDYDFALVRTDEAGVTSGNDFEYHNQGNHGLTLEFNADETVNGFDTNWWQSFRAAVQAHPAHTGDWTAAQALVDGREAIVIGQIGIDTQHSAHAEIHPVQGLAIHTETSSCEDVWEVFSRNWGNEGFCSQDQHYFVGSDMTVYFPNPTNSIQLSIDQSTNLRSRGDGVKWGQKAVSTGLVVTFQLPKPQDQAIAFGELRLKKTPCDQTLVSKAGTPRLKLNSPHLVDEGDQPLDYGSLLRIDRLLSARQSSTFHAAVAALPNRRTFDTASSSLDRDDSVTSSVKGATAELQPTDPRVLVRAPHEYDTKQAADRLAVEQALQTSLGGSANLERFINGIMANPEVWRDTDSYLLEGTVVKFIETSSSISSSSRWRVSVEGDSQSIGGFNLILDPVPMLETNRLAQPVALGFMAVPTYEAEIKIRAQAQSADGKQTLSGDAVLGRPNWILDPTQDVTITLIDGQGQPTSQVGVRLTRVFSSRGGPVSEP